MHCCAVDPAALAALPAHRHLLPLEQSARAALEQDDPAQAAQLAIDVLELAPGRLEALRVLYTVRAPTHPPAAEALIRRFAAIDPNDFWALNQLALLLLNRGSAEEAEAHARNAIRIAPLNAQSHYLMGMVLTALNRPAVGEPHFHRAIRLAGTREAPVLSNLALCLKNQGKMSAARHAYAEALSLAADCLPARLGLARLEEADRNLDAALAVLQDADPANPSVLLTRALILGRRNDHAGALALLDRTQNVQTRLAPEELLERGRLLDRMGRHAEAYAAFEDGKRTLREMTGLSYRAEQAIDAAARLRAFFTAGRLAALPRARPPVSAPRPLFVLGFPRSGTTLMEQMLSAHPRIAAADELPFVHDLTLLMPRMLESPLAYPEALVELWMADHADDLDLLRDHYLRKVAQLNSIPADAAWFTDKMPLNEMHLGLIGLIFPHAPIVHLVRHPLDVVLSVFSNLLTHGFFCAYDLQSIAEHYVLVADLVEHYRAQMPLNYVRVRYEDLVDDPAAELARALATAGEPFDPSCLAFDENRRYARTASYAQVSEPLYRRSLYRYRNYLPQLRPLLPLLQPVIERLGYEV